MLRPIVLILAIALAWGLSSPGAAYADEIDLGATETIEVRFLGDPNSLVRIPPGAFGIHPPGTHAEITLDAPTCSGSTCISGWGLLVSFDGAHTGILEKPVVFQVGYDQASVDVFGGREEDLVLARFDGRNWVPMDEQVIDTERNVAWAPETQNIRQFVAVFAGDPTPVESTAWGRIKALFLPE